MTNPFICSHKNDRSAITANQTKLKNYGDKLLRHYDRLKKKRKTLRLKQNTLQWSDETIPNAL